MKNAVRLTLTLALSALLLPAVVHAAPRSGTRWWATFEAKQTIDWTLAKSYGTSDCYKRFWHDGTGRETITIRSRRTKVLAYRHNDRTPVLLKYGTWKPLTESGDGLPAVGRALRAAVEASGVEAGRCGGEPETFEQDRTDCGPRAVTYDVTFGFARGRLFPSVNGLPPIWNTCPLHAPKLFGRNWFAEAPAQASALQLLGGRRPLTVSRTMVDSDYDPAPTGSERRIRNGQVTWTLTLTPAKGTR